MNTATDLQTLRRKIRDRRALAAMMPPIGERRALRERAGLSLAEIAEAVGVSRQAVGHWELGERMPRPELAHRYVAVLGLLREAEAERA
jgi:DNA-binding XRE family transcriptional regulator